MREGAGQVGEGATPVEAGVQVGVEARVERTSVLHRDIGRRVEVTRVEPLDAAHLTAEPCLADRPGLAVADRRGGIAAGLRASAAEREAPEEVADGAHVAAAADAAVGAQRAEDDRRAGVGAGDVGAAR